MHKLSLQTHKIKIACWVDYQDRCRAIANNLLIVLHAIAQFELVLLRLNSDRLADCTKTVTLEECQLQHLDIIQFPNLLLASSKVHLSAIDSYHQPISTLQTVDVGRAAKIPNCKLHSIIHQVECR